MIVRKKTRLRHLLLQHWKLCLFAAGYGLLVVVLHKSAILPVPIAIPVAIPAMLGTALSILLGFRTSAAYDRWWEARKIWGAIVNDSRTLARQATTLFFPPDVASRPAMAALQQEIVYRQIAWNHVLARSLRGQDWTTDVEMTLATEEIDALQSQDNAGNCMLQTQVQRLCDALGSDYLDTFRFLQIEATLTRMCDHMGKCERIKNTVFPSHYSFLISLIVWVFLLLLPLGLVESMGWVTVPVAFAISTIFVLIERIAGFLQDPFENAITDTPMLALSRIIEINLRQQLGEADLPEKLEPVDGVLM